MEIAVSCSINLGCSAFAGLACCFFFSCSFACRFPMILMKNHLQPCAFSRCQGATSRTLRTPSKASREGPIYRLQWLVAGTLKVQGFLGKGSNRLMDEASTNRNFFVSVYDGHSTRFHTELYAKTRAHQIKDGTHRTIPLEYTGNFDEHSDEYMGMDQYLWKYHF